MTSYSEITPPRLGLRSYDVAMGFRNVDSGSALLIDHHHTHIAGMAAQLAGAIKGRDVVTRVSRLREIAAEVLKISPYAFDEVVKELAELELVRDIQLSGGEIISFSEQVPLAYDDVHQRIGSNLQNKARTEREEQLLVAVDSLAEGPLSLEELRDELGVDLVADARLRSLAEAAELVRQYRMSDGTTISTSPLFAFEQPDRLAVLFEHHSVEQIREAFGRIRELPGLAVVPGGTGSVIEEMIRLGLVQAPIVVGADGNERAFVTMPYGLDGNYLTTKKSVLEKALALIACVRCGQISGGATSIRNPDRLLAALSDPSRDYTLGGHSSTSRQYATLIRLGVIEAIPAGDYLAPRLVVRSGNTENLEVVRLARTLLSRQGEADPERGSENEAARLLFTGEDYLSSIETIAFVRRKSAGLDIRELREAWSELRGW